MKSLYLLLFAIIVIIASCKKDNHSACNTPPVAPDKYIFPVKPGNTGWNNLTSGAEKLRACQIPDSVLTKISTDGLIQSWLDFPLASEVLLSNSIPQGLDFFISNFSGLKELCSRKNSAQILYEYYQKMNPACIATFISNTDKGAYTFTFTYIEVLVAKDTILNHLPILTKKVLVSEAINKYNLKSRYEIDFGRFGAASSIFVCGRAMLNSQYIPFLNDLQTVPFLSSFLNDLRLPANEEQASQIVSSILTHSASFIK